MAEPTKVTGYRCESCYSIFDEPGDRVYECSRCGGTQVEERRCESCNIFMAKVADESCPECEEPLDELTETEGWETPDGWTFETYEEAVQWIADEPARARGSAIAIVSRENQAKADALWPRVLAVQEWVMANHSDAERTVENLRWRTQRGSKDLVIHSMEMPLVDLARFVDFSPELIAEADDFDTSYERRSDISKQACEAVLARLPGLNKAEHEAVEWYLTNTWVATFGSSVSVPMESWLWVMETIIEGAGS